MYLHCLHYRTTSQVQKQFQDGNSANVFSKSELYRFPKKMTPKLESVKL